MSLQFDLFGSDPTTSLSALPTIQELVDRKALFVINHSGGKEVGDLSLAA